MSTDFEKTLHRRDLQNSPLTKRPRRAQVLLGILRSWSAAEGVAATNRGLYWVTAHRGV